MQKNKDFAQASSFYVSHRFIEPIVEFPTSGMGYQEINFPDYAELYAMLAIIGP